MRRTSKLKNFVWYSLVTMLVTFAVLVSVVRLTIGSVSEYRQHLEDLAGRYLGKPVAISEMDARLVGINPTVVLDDISLLDEQSMEPLAHFSSIRISLNPVSSLRQLRPVVDLSIYGANIVAGLREDGTLQVQGVTLSQESRSNGSGALGAWLLGQSRLALRESTLVWRNWATGDEAVFAGGNLELQNLQNRHRLTGFVQLPEDLGKELQLAVDIRGDLLTQKDWQGELYVKAVQVQPASWLQQFDYRGLQLKQGTVDLELWSTWQGGLLEGLEGKFNLADLRFSGAQEPLQLRRLAGQVRYRSGDDGWRLQLRQLQIRHGDLPDEQLALEVEKNAEVTLLQATSLPLDLLQRYAPYLPSLHPRQQDLIAQTVPAGKLKDVHIELGEEDIRATAELEGVKFSSWDRYPGVSGLSGHFAMDGKAAELMIDSTDLELMWPRLFRQPLKMRSARGRVMLNKQDEKWRISANALQLANQDVQGTVSFDSWVQRGSSPLVSLLAKLENAQAVAVRNYLPAHIMSAASVHWLDRAFVAGRVATGRVLLHGRLDQFPFRQPHGRFEVDLNAENVTLHYQDGWPDLSQVKGEVRFTGPSMTVDAQQASIYSSRLHKVHVDIADFRKPRLRVDGKADASLPDALRFIQASPLVQKAGGGLAHIRTQGKTDIDLALEIPLSKAVAAVSPLTVIGRAAIKRGEMQVADGVVFSRLNGNLLFTEASFEAKEIHGRLFDKPVKLQVFTEQVRENRQVVVAAQGRATAAALKRDLGVALLDRLDGETDWQSRLTIPYGGAGGSKLDLHSTLEGMAIDLPMPATKPREESRPLSVTLQLGEDKARTNRLVYGELVRMLWQQQSAPFKLLGASISFGVKSEPELLKPGVVVVNGALENLRFQEWRLLREEIKMDEGGALLPMEVEMQRLHLVPSATEGDGEPLRVKNVPSIRFVVNNLAYGDMALGKVELNVRPEDKKLAFDTFNVTAPSFKAVASGQWLEDGATRFDVTLSSTDFGRMMSDLGFASVIIGGKISAKGEVSWPGSPSAFDLGTMAGQVHVQIDDGRIEDVEPGAGKLLGLLSLQALPRRLFLDFSDLSGKGLQFTTIEGDIRLAEGDAFTQNLHLESLPANVLITGRTGLVQRDFEQVISVIPNVSDTVSVAGGLAWGPQAAAILLVLQKLFQSDIDAASMTRYQLSGTWSEPKLAKLNGEEPSFAEEGF